MTCPERPDPEYSRNRDLRRESGISSNWAYRQFMQTHAQCIMNFYAADAKTSIVPPAKMSESQQNPPFVQTPIRFKSSFDAAPPSASDLKSSYMEQRQTAMRMCSPHIPVSAISSMFTR